jgi:hypothetical protein
MSLLDKILHACYEMRNLKPTVIIVSRMNFLMVIEPACVCPCRTNPEGSLIGDAFFNGVPLFTYKSVEEKVELFLEYHKTHNIICDFEEPTHDNQNDPKSTDTQAPTPRHEPDPAGSPEPLRML